MNLNQLRAFYHVAKSLNFSVAAENLYVTQPAVTKQIKMFQESCKVRLFNKIRGRLHLTNEGKKIFVFASRIFELERQLEETIIGLQNRKQGSLRIGTTKTYAKIFMPLLLSPFRKTFPEIIIELDEGSSLSMTESLLDFTNSLAIVTKVEEKPEIVFTPFMLEPIVLIASPQHRLAQRQLVEFHELAGEPFVMKELGSGTRKLVEQFAHDEKTRLNVIAQTSNMDFIKQLVIQKQAISYVVRSSVEAELSQRELISIPVQPSGHLTIYIAYMRGYDLAFPAKAFLDYLMSLVDPDDLPVGTDSFAEKLGKDRR
jgi:DNA-binding transcriptional LysR family regulator